MEQTPSFSDLWKIAQSPAGQQLIAWLQQAGGHSLQEAINKANSGDYNAAKNILSTILESSEAKSLLKQLEDTP